MILNGNVEMVKRTDAIRPSAVVALDDDASVVVLVDVVVDDKSCDDVIVKHMMNTRIVLRILMIV